MKFIFKNNNQFLLIILLLSSLVGNAIFNLISVIFITKIFYEIFKNKDTKYFNQTWFKLAIILFIIFVTSSLMSEYSNLILLKNLTLIRFMFIALCVQYCLQKYNAINSFLYTILFMTIFVSFDALIQYFFGVNLFGNNLNTDSISRTRLTGIFGDEEIVGGFLIKFICLGVAGIIIFFKNNKKIIYSYYSIVGLTILLSQERMAFILMSFLTFIILIYFLWKKKFKSIIIILFISLTTIPAFFNFDESLKKRYLSTFTSGSGLAKVTFDDSNKPINFIENFSDLNDIDISFKDSMWGAHYMTAFEIFKENVLFGSGTRSFRYECNKEKYGNLDSHYIKKRCSTHPHNYYLEILSETGIVGFLYLLFLLCIFFYYEYKFYSNTKDITHLFGVLSIFINLWPLASTGSIYASFNGLVIWISIGYVLSFSNNKI